MVSSPAALEATKFTLRRASVPSVTILDHQLNHDRKKYIN